jgi:superoxide reductase
MTEKFQIYKCEFCENMVEITRCGSGQLICCGQPMQLCMENRDETIRPSHIPVLERTSLGLMVRVGIIEHPMEQKHHIEWIEVIAEGMICRQFLRQGDTPSALFDSRVSPTIVREYCNRHGLWRGYLVMNDNR